MKYFTENYLKFFEGLAFNNDKSWFDKHRKEYEDHVREPFKKYTADMIKEISKFDKRLGKIEPKDVMFRINRDIRFSNDKTPYNLWLSAAIIPGGKKKNLPGYYYRFAVDGVSIGGGHYHPDKDQLQTIRKKLVKNGPEFKKLLSSAGFKKHWGELHGEENKIIPKEFKAAAVKNSMIKKKEFTFWEELPATEVINSELFAEMAKKFKAAHKVVEWLDVSKS